MPKLNKHMVISHAWLFSKTAQRKHQEGQGKAKAFSEQELNVYINHTVSVRGHVASPQPLLLLSPSETQSPIS